MRHRACSLGIRTLHVAFTAQHALQAGIAQGARQIVFVKVDSERPKDREGRGSVIHPEQAEFFRAQEVGHNLAQAIDRINRLALSVRCSRDPMALAAPIQKEVQRARSTLLITNVTTLEKQVQISLRRERLVSTLATAFGALALVLACIGLYGVLAYAVTRRTSEIGIRMALGATSSGMVWMILREAAVLAMSGIAVAVPALLALGNLSRALLYGVDSFDLPAFACALLVLLLSATIAGTVPARRAGRLDPVTALRVE